MVLGFACAPTSPSFSSNSLSQRKLVWEPRLSHSACAIRDCFAHFAFATFATAVIKGLRSVRRTSSVRRHELRTNLPSSSFTKQSTAKFTRLGLLLWNFLRKFLRRPSKVYVRCCPFLADSKINRQRLRFFTSSAHISSVRLILRLQLKNRHGQQRTSHKHTKKLLRKSVK